MTRASHNTVSVVRMSQINRKTGSGGTYPTWMRTLEEKYQKLHKKITESSLGYGRFNSCVGRTVHDVRLSQALLRYKDLAAQRHSLKSKSATKAGEINNYGNSNATGENEKPTELNQYLDNDRAIEMNNEEFENCEKDMKCRPKSPESDGNSQIFGDGNYIEEETSARRQEQDDLHEKDVLSDSDYRPQEELPVADGSVKHVISFDKGKTKTINDSDKLNVNKYSRKTLKTSVSRTSKVTSKSCPANYQAKNLEKYHQRRILMSRSKSASRQVKMFTPMSEEAKHAITETIHEMHHLTPGRQTVGEVNFVPTGGRKCVKSWIVPKRTNSSLDVSNVLESASQRLINLKKDGNGKSSETENDSCRSSGGTIPEDAQKTNSLLPDIQTGSARDRSTHKNSSYRLPGIGKYDIAQDDPKFEITPPGYDIRYNDVEVKEERESETPPPDIRQRAIDKCSEWLTKYNK